MTGDMRLSEFSSSCVCHSLFVVRVFSGISSSAEESCCC